MTKIIMTVKHKDTLRFMSEGASLAEEVYIHH